MYNLNHHPYHNKKKIHKTWIFIFLIIIISSSYNNLFYASAQDPELLLPGVETSNPNVGGGRRRPRARGPREREPAPVDNPEEDPLLPAAPLPQQPPIPVLPPENPPRPSPLPEIPSTPVEEPEEPRPIEPTVLLPSTPSPASTRISRPPRQTNENIQPVVAPPGGSSPTPGPIDDLNSEPTKSDSKSGLSRRAIIIICVCVAIVLFFLLVSTISWIYMKRYRDSRNKNVFVPADHFIDHRRNSILERSGSSNESYSPQRSSGHRRSGPSRSPLGNHYDNSYSMSSRRHMNGHVDSITAPAPAPVHSPVYSYDDTRTRNVTFDVPYDHIAYHPNHPQPPSKDAYYQNYTHYSSSINTDHIPQHHYSN